MAIVSWCSTTAASSRRAPTRRSPPPGASTPGWRNYSSRWLRSRPPSHPVDRYSRHRVFVFTGIDKAVLFVKTDSAKIILVDEKVEALRRKTFGFIKQGKRDVGAPMLWRDYDLVKVHRFWVDSYESGQRATSFCKHDLRYRHQLVAPALAPPGDAGVEVEMRIVLRPGTPPQFDRRIFISGDVPAQRARFLAHRSVSLNSMRRLRWYASSVLPRSIG